MSKINHIKNRVNYYKILFTAFLFLLWVNVVFGVWLRNAAYMYDGNIPQESFVDFNWFFIYNDISSIWWRYFYYEGSTTWNWDIAFLLDAHFYSKIRRKFTGSWYIWLLSGYSYSDTLYHVQMSYDSNGPNSQYAEFINGSTLPYDQQTESWYWVWIDKEWYFWWKSMIYSEPFDHSNYNSWTTIWRPMPFDTDWDNINDNIEPTLFIWTTNTTVDEDNDTINNGVNDYDSDWDWWSDWEEYCLLYALNDRVSKPGNDSSLLVTASVCGSWPEWDCDGDWLTNKQEQQFCSDMGTVDTDGDWLNDFQEYITWKNPNDAYDANLDTDGDDIIDSEEISWKSISYNYKDISKDATCNYISFNWTVYLDIYKKDTDSDGIEDREDQNPNNWDIDWDWIPDWVDPDPLVHIACNDPILADWDTCSSDGEIDCDELPDWWENMFNDWKNNWLWSDWLWSDWVGVKNWCSTSLIASESLNPGSIDSDWDSILDWDEDFDWDLLTNYEEFINRTNPNNWDTDWDCIADKAEIVNWLNPNNGQDWNYDSDNDWISNKEEINGIDISITNVWTCLTPSYTKTVYLDPQYFDSDYDWVYDIIEINNKLDPTNPDTDGDWVLDWVEWWLIWRVESSTLKASPISCSTALSDSDWDLLYDYFEDLYSKGWASEVIFRKGATLSWALITDEFALLINNQNSDSALKVDPREDFDEDWLINVDEQKYWTDPNNWDSDWDMISDRKEIKYGLDPLSGVDANQDFDGDTLTNSEEINWVTAIVFDWLSMQRKTFETSPLKWDTDNDWLSDYREIVLWLNPTNEDTDWDGILDWIEITMWSNPRDNSSSINNPDWDSLPDDVEDYYNNWWLSTSNQIVRRGSSVSVSNGYALESVSRISNTQFTTGAGGTMTMLDDSIFLNSDKYRDFDMDWLDNYNELKNWTNFNHWDSDLDGVSDGDELRYGMNPLNKDDAGHDFDRDWIINSREILETFTNPLNFDTDKDGLSDNFELVNGLDPLKWDSDTDGITDGIEYYIDKTFVFNPGDPGGATDTDNDGLYDIFENYYSKWKPWTWMIVRENEVLSWTVVDDTNTFILDSNSPGSWSLSNRLADFDLDWLTNYQEMLNWTNPNNWDSDWDRISDWVELIMLHDPTNYLDKFRDSDWDYLSDLKEYTVHKTNMFSKDSDHDGMNDRLEIKSDLALDPNDPDTDNDNYPDWIEYTLMKLWIWANPVDNSSQPDYSFDTFSSLADLAGWDTKFTSTLSKEIWRLDSFNNFANIGLSIFSDEDLDWLNKFEELFYWTNPNTWDSDWDGISDQNDPFPSVQELSLKSRYNNCSVDNCYNKCNWDIYCLKWFRAISDKDQDWITDTGEIIWTQTWYWNYYDTDWDSLWDEAENIKGKNILNWDSDNNSLPDWLEENLGDASLIPVTPVKKTMLDASWDLILNDFVNQVRIKQWN